MTQFIQEFTFVLILCNLLCSSSCLNTKTSSSTIKSYIVPVIKAKNKLPTENVNFKQVNLLKTLHPTYSVEEAIFSASHIQDSIASSQRVPESSIINYIDLPELSEAESSPKTVSVLPPSLDSSLKYSKKEKSSRQGKFLKGRKKKKLLKLFTNFVGGNDDDDDGDEDDDPNTSKTAKAIGDVTGELVGLVISNHFKEVGEFVADMARKGVKNLLVTSLDSVFKSILTNK